MGSRDETLKLPLKCTSDAVLDKYFSDLEKVMVENNLLSKPENIRNIDETGLLMEHSPANVVYEKGAAPQAVNSSRAQNVTFIACGHAVSCILPPFYIFPGKRWTDSFLDGATHGAAGTMSETD